jgi:hypothetical protein
MILRDIKKIIEERGQVCISELYSLTDADKGLVDQVLSDLLEKRIIIEVVTESACKGCSMRCNERGERVFRLS